MSAPLTLVIRIDDRPAALERTLGRLRCRLRENPRISLGPEEGGILQLVVSVEEVVGSRDQLRAEIEGLHDVRSVREVPGAGGDLHWTKPSPDAGAEEAPEP